MRRVFAGVFALFALGGCLQFGNTDPPASTGTSGTSKPTTKVTGSLGAFNVTAQLKKTTCGSGALGMPNQWTFVAGLGQTKTTGVCTWDVGGGPISGTCGGAVMSFAGKVVVDMRAGGDGTLPACSIERDDTADITLDNATHPGSFSGTMTYTFTPTTASNCADLVVSQMPQFLTLPCTAEYALSASAAKT